MPIATFNKKLLFRLLAYEMDTKALEDQITKMGLDVEGQTKEELTVEFPSNRPDLLGTVGLARALKNFMHRSRRFTYKLEEHEPVLSIEAGEGVGKIRPYISGLVVEGARFDDELLKDIINFTEKLCETYGRKRQKIAIGMHNYSAIKGQLRYDAFPDEEFVPLGGNVRMRYSKIVAEHQKGMEYGHILKGKYVALKDDVDAIALIPIINSERTKVTEKTTDLFIDITGTSKYVIDKTADIMAAMFMDLGAKVKPIGIVGAKYGEESPKMASEEMMFPLFQAEREIGVAIGFNNSLSLLEKMGYEGALVGKMIRARVPAYRVDVLNEQDVIEDFAIAYGYDYIRPLAIASSQQGELEKATLSNRRISMAMLGLGFIEVMNSFLTNERDNFESMRLQRPPMYITVKNAVTISLTMMRTWLLPSLLKNISASKNDRMPLKAFEVDLAFNMQDKIVSENYHLAAVETGPRVNFNDMKAYINALGSLLGVELKMDAAQHGSFIDGRCAKVTAEGIMLGYAGEIHPQVLSNFGIEEPTIGMDLSLAEIDL